MVVSWWVFAKMDGFGFGFCLRALTSVLYGGLTCIFAVGGAVVGSITGALKGQTTETGFYRGAMIGSVAGAVLSVEILESLTNGESLSKSAIFGSLVDGKIFREWVSPAMLRAYQWQISNLEASEGDSSDIFDVGGSKEMAKDFLQRLPQFAISCEKTIDPCGGNNFCSICLQDFIEGESARRLPTCTHFFHLLCIDRWLVRQASCPICRQEV